MPRFDLIGSASLVEDNGTASADFSIEIEAKDENDALRKAKRKLTDFAFSTNREGNYSISDFDFEEGEGLTFTVSIIGLPEFNWFTVLLDVEQQQAEDSSDVDQLVSDWIFEFFDANKFKVTLNG